MSALVTAVFPTAEWKSKLVEVNSPVNPGWAMELSLRSCVIASGAETKPTVWRSRGGWGELK